MSEFNVQVQEANDNVLFVNVISDCEPNSLWNLVQDRKQAVTCSIDCRLIGPSKQDFIVKGQVGNMYYVIGFDGHGGNNCIHFLKKILTQENYDSLAQEESTVRALFEKVEQRRIDKKLCMIDSGATCYVMKMFLDEETRIGKVVIEHSGDSEIRVYKNGEKILVTECHDGFNEKEMERLRNEKLLNPFEGKIACKSIKVVNRDFIEASDAFYIKYANGAKFAMTQSLGHNGGTGCAPQFWSCDFNMDTDAMRVIGFSDGISDIFGPHNDIIIGLDVDASYICSTAEFLWKKEWKFYTPDIDPLTKKAKLDENGQTLMRVAKQVFGEKGYDDLSCGVIQSFPLKKI